MVTYGYYLTLSLVCRWCVIDEVLMTYLCFWVIDDTSCIQLCESAPRRILHNGMTQSYSCIENRSVRYKYDRTFKLTCTKFNTVWSTTCFFILKTFEGNWRGKMLVHSDIVAFVVKDQKCIKRYCGMNRWLSKSSVMCNPPSYNGWIGIIHRRGWVIQRHEGVYVCFVTTVRDVLMIVIVKGIVRAKSVMCKRQVEIGHESCMK